MANLFAFEQFDIDTLNLNFYVENFESESFQLDANFRLGDVVYPDFYSVRASDGAGIFTLEVYGEDFELDAAGNLAGGIVNAIAEFEGTDPLFAVEGLAVDLAEFFAPFLTPSTDDDAGLIAEIFADDDTIVLSDFDDVVAGYRGDDTIIGGDGIDTVIIFGSARRTFITNNDDGSVTVQSEDGTDTLIDVEFIALSDPRSDARGERTIIPLVADSGPPPPPPPPPASNDDPDALLVLQEGSVVGLSEGFIAVVGTAAGDETVRLSSSPSGPLAVRLDPSFNLGGDTIQFAGAATDYTIARVGSSVVIANDDISATIPVGTAGAAIRFDGGDERTLRFDTAIGEVVLGEQVIPISASSVDSEAALAAAPADAALLTEAAIPSIMIESFAIGA